MVRTLLLTLCVSLCISLNAQLTWDAPLNQQFIECEGDDGTNMVIQNYLNSITATSAGGQSCLPITITNNFIPLDSSETDCNTFFTISLSATDVCGNILNGFVNIQIDDFTPPELPLPSALPPDLFLECKDRIPAPEVIILKDNCKDVEAVLEISSTTGNCENKYTEERRWFFWDSCNNYAGEHIQIIEVEDNTTPEWIGNTDVFLPNDITLSIPESVSSYTFPNGYFENEITGESWPIYPPMAGSEFLGNCSGDVFINNGLSPMDEFPVGVHEIKYIVEDQCSNFIEHTFAVTIGVSSTLCKNDVPQCAYSCETIPDCHTCNVYDLLDGLQSCTPEYLGTIQPWPPSLCFGSGVPHNMSWYSFVAGDTTLSLTIAPTYCKIGNGAVGIQSGIYDFCEDNDGQCIGGDANCTSGLEAMKYTVDNLKIGRIYYLFVDGCNGAECDYTITVDSIDPNAEGELGPDSCPSEVLILQYYIDTNNNGVKDSIEQYLNLSNAGEFVTLNPNEFISAINQGTEEYFILDPGFYDLSFENDLFVSPSLPAQIEVIEDQGEIRLDVALIANPANIVQDAEVSIVPNSIDICDRVSTYSLKIKNIGNMSFAGSISLDFDSLLIYQSATEPPMTFTDNQLIWDINISDPFQFLEIDVDFKLPSADFINNHFCLKLNVIDNPQITINEYCFELRCSYDPNDKHGIPYRGGENYTLFDETLEYTIRFENLGNFYAEDIRIEDELSEYLDIETLSLNASSHPIDRFYVNSQGRLKVFFEDINLPSVEMDSILNKGYIQFSINSMPGLAENTEVFNKAEIYFDYNDAIVTNETHHTLVSELPIINSNNNLVELRPLKVFPNPANNKISIITSFDINNASQINILNISGQVILKYDAPQKDLDIQGLQSGIYFIKVDSQSDTSEIGKFVKL